jgi:hypothetical protein
VKSCPDIIITDLSMPIVDGWETIRRLRADQRTRSIPIIVCTGLQGGAVGRSVPPQAVLAGRSHAGSSTAPSSSEGSVVRGGSGSVGRHWARWLPERVDSPPRYKTVCIGRARQMPSARVDVMPVEIEGFLATYEPKSICIDCLGAVTTREEADVRSTILMLLAERRAETQVGECFNCNATSLVVRRRRR